MYAFILLAQLTMPDLPEPLSLGEPTLAAPCQCRPGEACQCEVCDCHPTAKPALVSVRKPRIDSTSPITLAPDPDYDDAIAAFKERWSDPTRKVYVGKTLPPESVQRTAAGIASSARTPQKDAGPTQPPQQQPAPIDRAAMVWSCQGGQCQWVPAAAAPTKSVQTYRRGFLFRRR